MKNFQFMCLAVGLFTGCAVQRVIVPVAESFVEVPALKLEFSENSQARLQADLQLTNPQNKPGRIIECQWDLYVEGRHFASGIEALGKDVPASASAHVALNLPIEFRNLSLQPRERKVVVTFRGMVVLRWDDSELALSFMKTTLDAVVGAPLWNVIVP